jgi:putative oxidoreductase
MAAFFMSRFEEVTLAILRVMAGLMLMQHGAQKLLGLLGGEVAPVLTRGWVAGWLELVLGALLVLGLCTRIAAFILSGELAFAYFLVHAGKGFWPVMNRGELAALYCFVFLYLSARGGGLYSLDALLARRPGLPLERRPAS